MNPPFWKPNLSFANTGETRKNPSFEEGRRKINERERETIFTESALSSAWLEEAEAESVLRIPVKYYSITFDESEMYDAIKTMLGRWMYFGVTPVNKILIY